MNIVINSYKAYNVHIHDAWCKISISPSNICIGDFTIACFNLKWSLAYPRESSILIFGLKHFLLRGRIQEPFQCWSRNPLSLVLLRIVEWNSVIAHPCDRTFIPGGYGLLLVIVTGSTSSCFTMSSLLWGERRSCSFLHKYGTRKVFWYPFVLGSYIVSAGPHLSFRYP